ncbi:MAG: hypothetical protein IIB38_04620 [Candidatus Hydrogenedentes bacterium]|nr:hypothetical protein [Candidatus Hydrogenedentota bacterium]
MQQAGASARVRLVTAAGFAHLRRMPYLRTLWLEWHPAAAHTISDEVVGYISELANLRELMLESNWVFRSTLSREAIENIAKLKLLSVLKLIYFHQLDISALASFAYLPRLQTLSLDGCYNVDSTALPNILLN